MAKPFKLLGLQITYLVGKIRCSNFDFMLPKVSPRLGSFDLEDEDTKT